MNDIFEKLEKIFDDAFVKAAARRRRIPSGCAYCDAENKHGTGFHPHHDASPRCESGKRNHCSCDICF